MCGRYTLSEFDRIETRFKLNEYPVIKSRYNIAPSQNVPVIINDGINRLEYFRWGLVPHWAKDLSIGNKLINARTETLDVKLSFKVPLQRRRCIVVADGFYEWKKEGTTKVPYRITLKPPGLFGFAGLWESWHASDGRIINSCAIITTTPNELMKSIHDRMPVILELNAEEVWLDNRVTDTEQLKAFLRHYTSDLMTAYKVSALVNSPRNDLPDCIKKVK